MNSRSSSIDADTVFSNSSNSIYNKYNKYGNSNSNNNNNDEHDGENDDDERYPLVSSRSASDNSNGGSASNSVTYSTDKHSGDGGGDGDGYDDRASGGAEKEETVVVVLPYQHHEHDGDGGDRTKQAAAVAGGGGLVHWWTTRVWGDGSDEEQRHALWRDMVAFFICGVLNNYSYVVMLSAAEEMLEGYAGVVLLFNILPALILKLFAPFFMHVIPYNLRISIVVLFAVGSFQFVGWFDFIGLKLFGVTLASLSSGLGEITFLAMSSYYHKDVISAWSSGTGGAGIFGALSYLALTAWFGITDFMTLMVITVAPLFMILAAFGIMSGYHSRSGFCSSQKRASEQVPDLEAIAQQTDDTGGIDDTQDGITMAMAIPSKPSKTSVSAADLTLTDKIKHIIPLMKYMIPLFVVYYSEYLINQGVAPTITFKRGAIKGKQAYVYYQFLYQAGVFVSRSSVKIFHIRRVWIPSALQCVNLVILLIDAYFRLIPNIFIVFVIIFWEGLLGGAAYVNSFYNISIEVEPEFKEFSLGVASVADSMGITLSGLTSSFLQSWLLAVQRKKPF